MTIDHSQLQFGGQQAVTLRRAQRGDEPQLLSATVLPGCGMHILQVTAWLPGQGEISLLHAPTLPEAARAISSDASGAVLFTFGGAFLYPFANRICGPLSDDQRTLTTQWNGRSLQLTAGHRGKFPGARPHAIHGFVLQQPASNWETTETAEGVRMHAQMDCGDFGGRWFSASTLKVDIELQQQQLLLDVVACNTGTQDEPVSIGWHPYFRLPSGDRKQVELTVPGRLHTEVNNYDDVFPTGRLIDVTGTAYDFIQARALGNTYLDDHWSQLLRDEHNEAAVTLVDRAAGLGLRLVAASAPIQAFQVYAPVEKPFVAIEPQFNHNDPFNPSWGDQPTGMVTLAAGEQTHWCSRLEIFAPAAQ